MLGSAFGLTLSIGCGTEDPTTSLAVHLQGLLAVEQGSTVQLFGAGFGDDTVRFYRFSDSVVALQQIVWSGSSVQVPTGADNVGLTQAAGVQGPWGLAVTPAGQLLVSGRLSHSLNAFTVQTGPLTLRERLQQGEPVEGLGPRTGLVPIGGLYRPGPIAVEPGWAYVGGQDALALFAISPDEAEFAGAFPDLSGADALLALDVAPSATISASMTPIDAQLVVVRCRGRNTGSTCLDPSDPSEIVLLDRLEEDLSPRQRVVPVEEADEVCTTNCDSDLSLLELLGDGHLAHTLTASGTDLILAAFEGSASVVGLERTRTGTLSYWGAKRVVAPWQDPLNLPDFALSTSDTSTSAPLRIGQVAVARSRVFVAVTSGGFVAHFPTACLQRTVDDATCLEFVCLDQVGGCAGPSAASATPVYPEAVTATADRVFVSVDVTGPSGATTSRVAVLIVDAVGTVTLLGLTDA